jgi:hypothetical protein
MSDFGPDDLTGKRCPACGGSELRLYAYKSIEVDASGNEHDPDDGGWICEDGNVRCECGWDGHLKSGKGKCRLVTDFMPKKAL